MLHCNIRISLSFAKENSWEEKEKKEIKKKKNEIKAAILKRDRT